MRTMRSKRGDMTEKEWELVQQLHEGTNTSATIDSLTEMVFDAESNDTADSEEVDALAPLKVPRPRSKIESDMLVLLISDFIDSAFLMMFIYTSPASLVVHDAASSSSDFPIEDGTL